MRNLKRMSCKMCKLFFTFFLVTQMIDRSQISTGLSVNVHVMVGYIKCLHCDQCQNKKLCTAQRAMERQMLHISLRDRNKCTDTQKKTGVRDIIRTVKHQLNGDGLDTLSKEMTTGVQHKQWIAAKDREKEKRQTEKKMER